MCRGGMGTPAFRTHIHGIHLVTGFDDSSQLSSRFVEVPVNKKRVDTCISRYLPSLLGYFVLYIRYNPFLSSLIDISLNPFLPLWFLIT